MLIGVALIPWIIRHPRSAAGALRGAHDNGPGRPVEDALRRIVVCLLRRVRVACGADHVSSNCEVAALAQIVGLELAWYRSIPADAQAIIRWQAQQADPPLQRLLTGWPMVSSRGCRAGRGAVLCRDAAPRKRAVHSADAQRSGCCQCSMDSVSHSSSAVTPTCSSIAQLGRLVLSMPAAWECRSASRELIGSCLGPMSSCATRLRSCASRRAHASHDLSGRFCRALCAEPASGDSDARRVHGGLTEGGCGPLVDLYAHVERAFGSRRRSQVE